MLSRYVGKILMNLLDGEGQFTWPNGGTHLSICMFQITLTLYWITFNALQIRGRDSDEPLDGEGQFTWPNGGRHQSTYIYVSDNFNALSDNV